MNDDEKRDHIDRIIDAADGAIERLTGRWNSVADSAMACGVNQEISDLKNRLRGLQSCVLKDRP